MSSLSRFFKSKPSAKAQVEASKENLQKTLDLLNKKLAFLEKQVEEEVATAKQYGMANKRKALEALRRKKRAQDQLLKVDGSIQILESQIDTINNAQMNNEIFKTLKQSTNSMKSVHDNVKLEQVTGVIDDIREQQDIAREISDAISDPAGFGAAYDEDELLNELQTLQDDMVEKELLNVDLPTVPVADLPEPGTSKPEEEKVDQSLNDLMEWAS